MLEGTPNILTVAEINDLFRNTASISEPKVRVRYIPKEAIGLALEMADGYHQDLLKASDYIQATFHIMRACVNNHAFGVVPFVRSEEVDVYQWPRPDQFDWVDVDSVMTLNRIIEDPNTGQVRIFDLEKGRKRVSFPNNPTMFIPGFTNMTVLEERVMKMDQFFGFQVPKTDRLGGFRDAYIWQNDDLLPSIGVLYQINRNLISGSLTETMMAFHLKHSLDLLGRERVLRMQLLEESAA